MSDARERIESKQKRSSRFHESTQAKVGIGAFAVLARSGAGAPVLDTPADADPSGLLARLVDRITFGFTPKEYDRALSLGYEGYLEYHLAHLLIDDSAMEAELVSHPILTTTYPQNAVLDHWSVRTKLVDVRIHRAIASERQLFERVVDMWTNHFHIFTGEDNDSANHKPIDDRDVIRAHALGNFRDMLLASMRSPAMLQYLDNRQSTGDNPNENYARELMELHTLGVHGGYTQADVANLALILTGWGWDGRSEQPTYGRFRFDPDNHSTLAKTFLGVSYPGNEGEQEGVRAFEQLASHVSTAEFVAAKICREFLGEDVPASTVGEIADVFVKSNGDIKAMIRKTLRPERLAASGRKFKRPFHFAISILRALEGTMSDGELFWDYLISTGNFPFHWPAPNGLPDSTLHWTGNMLPRWNFAARLMDNGYRGLHFNVDHFFAGVPNTADGILAHINSRIFGGRMAPSDLEEIRQFLLPDPPGTTKRNQALGLAFGSPSFQWF